MFPSIILSFTVLLVVMPEERLLLKAENETKILPSDEITEFRTKFTDNTDSRQRRSSSVSTADVSKHFVHIKHCVKDSECVEYNSKCDTGLKLCYCPPMYVSRQGLDEIMITGKTGFEGSRPSQSSKFCFKAAIYGDACNFDEQCVIKNSACTAPNFDNDPKKTCVCGKGFTNEAGYEKVTIGSNEVVSRVVCRFHQTHSNTFFIIVIIVGLISIIMLSSCLIILIKMKNRKPRPVSETLTSISGNGVPMGQPQYAGQQQMQSAQVAQMQASQAQAIQVAQQQHQQQQQQQQQQQAQAQGQQGYSVNTQMGEAYMGSAQAEFQNDFIAVFPMHHLEPCPEKNTSAIAMQ